MANDENWFDDLRRLSRHAQRYSDTYHRIEADKNAPLIIAGAAQRCANACEHAVRLLELIALKSGVCIEDVEDAAQEGQNGGCR